MDTVEAVLDAINADLVMLLNQRGAHAIGLSGSDAALLRAKKLVRETVATSARSASSSRSTRRSSTPSSRSRTSGDHPVGLGLDGQSYNLKGDSRRGRVAKAIGADKLIFLSDAPASSRPASWSPTSRRRPCARSSTPA